MVRTPRRAGGTTVSSHAGGYQPPCCLPNCASHGQPRGRGGQGGGSVDDDPRTGDEVVAGVVVSVGPLGALVEIEAVAAIPPAH